jgi:hypothetical protein
MKLFRFVCVPCREIPVDGWNIFVVDETRNESRVVSPKTWFRVNGSRSCFFICANDRRWKSDVDERLLK